MITKEEADEKVREGWIRLWFMFEVLAIDENTTKNSLESLINQLEKDIRIRIYKKDFGVLKKVEKPIQNVEFGYSLTCEIEFISKNFDNTVQIVTEYGPSAIEFLEPSKINLNAAEAQAILNTISEIMHQFASAGAGGIVFIKGTE